MSLDKPVEGLLRAMIGLLWALFGIIVGIIFFSLGLAWRGIDVGRDAVFNTLRDVFNVLGTVVGGIVWAMMGIIIAGAVIWFFSSVFPDIIQKTKAATTSEKREDALELLRLRLAKGEITKEEYFELKKLLEESR